MNYCNFKTGHTEKRGRKHKGRKLLNMECLIWTDYNARDFYMLSPIIHTSLWSKFFFPIHSFLSLCVSNA